MSTAQPQTVTTISLTDLESLLHRVVRDAVHEELTQLLRRPRPEAPGDWEHEGPDDPQGDADLLVEALTMSQQYHADPQGWDDWVDFKAEMNKAEAAGELLD
ncbi:MAG: hypothetical protein HY784_12870 [Chloroflexi bacterium]|nr:hypothetical protein [Chloroflexota bacterium]